MDILLIQLGMSVLATLGTLHLVYSLLDLVEPKRFAPTDANLLEALMSTRIRLHRNVRTFWLSYIGFNVSHSVGILAFAGVYVSLTIVSPDTVFELPLVLIMLMVSLAYVAMSWLFWFAVPLAGSGLSTTLFLAAVILNRLGC